MTVIHQLYLTIKPHDLRLAATEGRILAIVDNYTEVFEKEPVITDGVTQVFLAEVRDDEVVSQQEGDARKLVLWKGDVGSRSRPHDKLTLPITSLKQLGGAGEQPSQAQQAITAFSELPDPVRLALIIMNTPSTVLITLPQVTPEQAQGMKGWADQVLTKHAAEPKV